MSKSVLYMSMSLDGYVAGPNDQPGNPGGDGFVRLHEWYGFAADAGPTEQTIDSAEMGRHFLDEIKETGAVLAGRNTVEQTDHWGGDHHDGVPIFVPSHRPPGPSVAKYPLVTYVMDGIGSAMAQAKPGSTDKRPGRSAVGAISMVSGQRLRTDFFSGCPGVRDQGFVILTGCQCRTSLVCGAPAAVG